MESLNRLGILLPNLLFHIANFLVVLWILNRFVYQPVLRLFTERRERIRQGLAEAESVRQEAAEERARLEEQLAEERRASQDRLRAAVTKSEEAAAKRLEEASAEADRILARATAEAEERHRQALAGLHGEIADLALRAAAKALREGIDEAQHRQLIRRFIEEDLGELA